MKKLKMSVVVNSLYFDYEDRVSDVEHVLAKLSKFFDIKLIVPQEKPNRFNSISVDERIRSFNKGLKYSNIILSQAGGFNSIELLDRFDELKFSKDTVFIGSSDGTILTNSLVAKGAYMSIYGPDFMKMVFDSAFTSTMAESIFCAITKNFKGLNKLLSQADTKVLQGGKLENVVILGGNNYTFDLLQGTTFKPAFTRPFVLLLEGEYASNQQTVKKEEIFADFIRNIDSVLLQPGAKRYLKGLIVGKFPDGIRISKLLYRDFIKDRLSMKGMPIAINTPFGHSKGALAVPLGLRLNIDFDQSTNQIKFFS